MSGTARSKLSQTLLLGAAAALAALAACGQRGPLFLPPDSGQHTGAATSTIQSPPPGASDANGALPPAAAPAGSGRDLR